ncbi:flagellar type III secretion system pore protein FliP [Buchnera aphidicola]|uniref:flagellar type III secretion system pore protein FliP n=1 Tax=Buchnera aphidicola TaxID=9 RepID=UPI00094C5322|nr:flagellar type III secretion system pore protein FliP [Buchnera aphidicola]
MMYQSLNCFLSIYATLLFGKIASDPVQNIIQNGFNVLNFSAQSYTIITLLSFVPACLLMMTCFTRIIIVFSFVRNALGTPYSPPNQVLISLALFLTFFIMSPVFSKMYNTAFIPLYKNEISINTALQNCLKPLSLFMIKQTRKSDILVFWNLAKIPYVMNEGNIPIKVLLPAFMISELKNAFQIGFTILLPFLIIDLVVASVLMSLGMIMIPPATISLPLKLIIFVLSDGWKLLILSLAKSFFT